VRVRTVSDSATTINFTTQIYFDDAVSNQVIADITEYDYGVRDTFNSNDDLYMAATQIVLAGDETNGFRGAIDIALSGLPASSVGECGDVDGSGDVTVTDGVRVLRAAAGLDVDLTCP